MLLELADRLEANIEPIAQLISREMGKPIRLSRVRELVGAVDKLRFFAGAARLLHGDVTGASPAHLLDLTIPEPVGVAALIIPWNDPVDLTVRKLGAALAAGCTVVVKSSEETPASTAAFLHLCDDLPGLEPGVINLLHGRGDTTGAALVAHPGVDKVSFTGSTETGMVIMAAAAKRLANVSVECGGKAPSLVFGDCDMAKAVDALAYGAFLYTGQSCTAATRIIVQRDSYDAFAEAFVARARSLPVGNPLDEGTLVGPLVSARQVARVSRFLDGIPADGGEILTGGTIEGQYLQPTVVAGLRPDAAAAREEIFGPVVALFGVDSEDEAIELANSVRYGLGASVWTSDINRAVRIARQLEFGDVWINTHYVRQVETPFGGWKESGIGRELGLAGVREYLAERRVCIDTAPTFHLADWFEGADREIQATPDQARRLDVRWRRMTRPAAVTSPSTTAATSSPCSARATSIWCGSSRNSEAPRRASQRRSHASPIISRSGAGAGASIASCSRRFATLNAAPSAAAPSARAARTTASDASSWRGTASRTARSSSHMRADTSARTSASGISVTVAPRWSANATRPSRDSMRSASRTGISDSPSDSASARRRSRSPGASAPAMICSRSCS